MFDTNYCCLRKVIVVNVIKVLRKWVRGLEEMGRGLEEMGRGLEEW